jgi:hypothetical protein
VISKACQTTHLDHQRPEASMARLRWFVSGCESDGRVARPAGFALARGTRSGSWQELETTGARPTREASWRARQDSNLRPLAPEANALSS